MSTGPLPSPDGYHGYGTKTVAGHSGRSPRSNAGNPFYFWTLGSFVKRPLNRIPRCTARLCKNLTLKTCPREKETRKRRVVGRENTILIAFPIPAIIMREKKKKKKKKLIPRQTRSVTPIKLHAARARARARK